MRQKFVKSVCYSRICRCVDAINKLVPVFHPESDQNIWWQMLTFFCTLTFLILIPIDLAFNNHLLSRELYIFTVLATTILLINMLAEINTGYLDYGHFIKDRMKIIKRHLRDGVLLDLVSVVTVLVVQVQQRQELGGKTEKEREFTSSFMLIFFSQFRHILIQKRSFDEQMNWSIFHRTVYDICIILFTVVYVQHCFSCIWAFIGLKEFEIRENNWIEKQNLSQSEWTELYLNSLYYTIVTFSSVGYGDLTPQSNTEKIFSLFFVLVSSLQLSYTLTRVGNLLEDLNTISSQTIRKMRVINNYMNRQGISLKLKHQVRDYLRMYWNQRSDFDEQDYREIIQDLSDTLKDQLMQETTQTMIHKIDFFDRTFSRWIKIELSQYVEQVNMSPDYLIPLSKEEETGNTYLYYLDQGLVEEVLIMNSRSDQIHTHRVFRSGSYFGLDQFISGEVKLDQYKTKGFCKLFRIEREKFITILKDYPLEYEKFCQCRDELNVFKSKHSQLRLIKSLDQKRCDFCRKDCTSLSECKAIHFIPDREKIIKSSTFKSRPQMRKPMTRSYRRVNSKINHKNTELQADIYVKSNKNPYDIIYDEIGEEEHHGSTPQNKHYSKVGHRVINKVFAGMRLQKQLEHHSEHQHEMIREQCTFLTYFHEETIRQQQLWNRRIKRLINNFSSQLQQNFSEKEVQSLQFIQLFLQNADPTKVILDLDHYHNFDEYSVKNNIDSILPNLTIQMRPIRFLKYLFFPHLYYEYYLQRHQSNLIKNDSKDTKIDYPLRRIKS